MRLVIEGAHGEVRGRLSDLFKSLAAVGKRQGASSVEILDAAMSALSEKGIVASAGFCLEDHGLPFETMEDLHDAFITFYQERLLPKMLEDICAVVERRAG